MEVNSMEKSYFDKCESNDEKTKLLIQNICDLAKYKGIKLSELNKKLGRSKSFISYCKHSNKIDFTAVLDVCDILGVSLNRLVTFSYANVVKRQQIDENKKRLAALRSEVVRLDMLVKEEEKAIKLAAITK